MLTGRGGGEGQALCNERSDLQRAERGDASEASESSQKRAVVYLKLGTKKPQITHHTSQTKIVHKMDNNIGSGTSAKSGARGEAGSRGSLEIFMNP